MRLHFSLPVGLLVSTLVLASCASIPEPEPEIIPAPVPVEAPPVLTCVSVDLLTKMVIPAEYKTGFSITGIVVPPDYVTDPETGEVREIINPPIESKVPYKKLIKPEEIIYVDSENRVITDICEVTPEGDIPTSVVPG